MRSSSLPSRGTGAFTTRGAQPSSSQGTGAVTPAGAGTEAWPALPSSSWSTVRTSCSSCAGSTAADLYHGVGNRLAAVLTAWMEMEPATARVNTDARAEVLPTPPYAFTEYGAIMAAN